MGQTRLTLILCITLMALSLAVLFETRLPLCLDSKILSSIEYQEKGISEILNSCQKKSDSEFKSFFSERLSSVYKKINSLEILLANLAPIKEKIKVVILKDQPLTFKIKDHQLEIGLDLFNSEGHLEKGILKIWYREKAGSWFLSNSLFEEVVTDFLIYISAGEVALTDPLHNFKTKIGGARWPQVIKSAQGYCESSWRLSEHYEACFNIQNNLDLFRSSIIQLSLRPLVSSSWIKAYKNLNYAERNQFLKSLPQILASNWLTPERHLAQALSDESPVQQALTGLRDFSNLMHQLELAPTQDKKNFWNKFYRKSATRMTQLPVPQLFVENFANDLRGAGLNDAFAEAFFDVLVMTDETQNAKSVFLKNFREMSKRNPQVQMAVMDNENLWMLPAEYPVRLKSFGQIKSAKMIVSRCGGFDFDYILSFSPMTEKLLVIDKCNKSANLDFSEFLKDGVSGFARKNKNVAFIQFHLPSLNLRKNELGKVRNIYDLIEGHNSKNAVSSALGWNEIKWDQQLQAYKPQAFIDGIEVFRTRTVRE